MKNNRNPLLRISGSLILFVLLASYSHLTAGPNTKQPQAEFVPMFNGEDLADWGGEGKTKVNGYVWANGMLEATPSCRYLMTDKSYSDYILEFEFKLTPGANNGLGIHYPGKGNPAYTGMEIQIIDGEHEKYRGKLKDFQHHGSLYHLKPALRGYTKPAGEWNFQRVMVKGPKVTVDLNGTRILDADLNEISQKHHKRKNATRRSGKIVFCGHNTAIYVRNMRIAELAPTQAPEEAK